MFKIKRWNNKYGNAAKFVVFDEKADKYAEFSPANPKDIAWVSSDITKNPEYKSWDDWKDEPVDNLGDIIM